VYRGVGLVQNGEAMTRTFFRPISIGLLLLLALLAITPFAMKVAVDTGVSAHAFTKHGSDALAA